MEEEGNKRKRKEEEDGGHTSEKAKPDPTPPTKRAKPITNPQLPSSSSSAPPLSSSTSSEKKTKKKRVSKYAAMEVPKFKIIPNTTILVDGFQYKRKEYTHYILTHGHSDHYVGLTKGFSLGPVYCTRPTANLISSLIGTSSDVLVPVPLHTLVWIQPHVSISFVDANHCPGAAVVLIDVYPTHKDGSPDRSRAPKKYVHTGDFRYSADALDSYIQEWRGGASVDAVFLDTTFLAPRFDFPPQTETIGYVLDLVRQAKADYERPLFLVGSYTIGKERIVMGLHAELGLKIYCSPKKYHLLSLLGRDALDIGAFTTNPKESDVHFVPMSYVSYKTLIAHGTEVLDPVVLCALLNGAPIPGSSDPQTSSPFQGLDPVYDHVFGIRPTGWNNRKKGGVRTSSPGPGITIVDLPYSEHSSYSELLGFVKSIRPKRVIPTVDCETQGKVDAQLKHFHGLVDNSDNRSTLLPFLLGKVGSGSGPGGRVKQEKDEDEDEDDLLMMSEGEEDDALSQAVTYPSQSAVSTTSTSTTSTTSTSTASTTSTSTSKSTTLARMDTDVTVYEEKVTEISDDICQIPLAVRSHQKYLLRQFEKARQSRPAQPPKPTPKRSQPPILLLSSSDGEDDGGMMIIE